MKEKQKKWLVWVIDKLDQVALGAYGLLAGEKWVSVVTVGISIPDAASLTALTVALVVVWAILGYWKGILEDL